MDILQPMGSRACCLTVARGYAIGLRGAHCNTRNQRAPARPSRVAVAGLLWAGAKRPAKADAEDGPAVAANGDGAAAEEAKGDAAAATRRPSTAPGGFGFLRSTGAGPALCPHTKGIPPNCKARPGCVSGRDFHTLRGGFVLGGD